MTWPASIPDEAALQDWLTRPSAALRGDLAALPGGFAVLGSSPLAEGLHALLRRADPAREVAADADAANLLVLDLPAGKLPWLLERYADARIAFLSAAAVLAPAAEPQDEMAEMAGGDAALLAWEAAFREAGTRRGTRGVGLRLGDAVDLRHGLLVETARAVWQGRPVAGTGHANPLWLGDAACWMVRALRHADAACPVIHAAGPETVPRRWLAQRLGALMGCEPVFAAEAPPTPLLNAAWAFSLFGYPSVPLEVLLHWVADWVPRHAEDA